MNVRQEEFDPRTTQSLWARTAAVSSSALVSVEPSSPVFYLRRRRALMALLMTTSMLMMR